MMKVKEVKIQNYKSICSKIKECRLKLDEKVTFLIGANESGKTNILDTMVKFSAGGFMKRIYHTNQNGAIPLTHLLT